MNRALDTLTIATAGHVDHGKSSLVKAITGIDTDTLAEEKARGLSINLGFAYLPLPALNATDAIPKTIAFVDVPGHADFTTNMLAGVGLVDTCMLIVAADDGIMPQTREHTAILDLLGVSRGCVVITKIDRVDAQRRRQMKDQLAEFLRPTSLRNLPQFEVSSVSGEGLPALIDYLQLLASTGEAVGDDQQHGPRFAIDRSFSVAGLGTVLTGTVVSGNLRTGDTLVHSGSGSRVRIKRLRHHDTDLPFARKGQRIAINIDLPSQQAKRGDWLLLDVPDLPITGLHARLRLTEHGNFKPLAGYHLHLGPAHHIVTVRRLDESGYFHLQSNEPMFACYGDRLILRDPAATRTLAGGMVIDCSEISRRRRVAQRIELLTALDQEDPAALQALLRSLPAGVELSRFAVSRNLSSQGIADVIAQLERGKIKPILLSPSGAESGRVIGQEFFTDYSGRLEQLLSDYHRAHPYHAGMSQSALQTRLQLPETKSLFPGLLQQLLQQGRVKREANAICLATHRVRVDPQQLEFMRRAQPLLVKGGFTAPRTFELAEALHLPPSRVEQHLRMARQAGQLIQIAPNRHYLPGTIRELAVFTEKLAASIPAGGGFSVQQFRDASNIGRNLCIEILEYFDQVGFTRRSENLRHLRTGWQQLFDNDSPPANPQKRG